MYYTINLYDGTPIKVQLEVYLDMNYMYWADVAMYVTGGIVFLLLLLMMIHHKIRYINRLESELKILGGGNLGDHSATDFRNCQRMPRSAPDFYTGRH